jgi:hypothetical protein
MISQILNFFAFQILWLGCVYGGGSLELTWMPWISLVPLILDTLYKSSRALDLKLATTAALLGYGLETIWVKLAILKFGDSTLPPIWMGFLWFGFALTINHSMKFFRDLTIVGPLIVGLFGPLTYLAGQRLGAVTIENYYFLLLIIPCWIGLFQLLKMQSSWLDKTDLVHTAKNIRPKQDANPSD